MSFLLDHRQLAVEMEIFFFDERIGAGLPIWLPNGVAIRDALEEFIKDRERRAGYQRVVSPHVGKSVLYEKSGHLDCFRENMFPPIQWPEHGEQVYLRPMNCPHHHLVFASSPRSYRQLPLRIAEYGQVYRYENSGSLHGLSRVRALCQNDAHIYIDPSQAEEEIGKVLDLHEQCYRVLGLNNYRYRLSKHDPEKPEQFFGPREQWQQCEEILRRALLERNLPFFEAQGEAAFYGPKIDVQMPLNRKEESIASIQLDFVSAQRFDLSYVARSGKSEKPWVIHRAPLGSHERFVAMLLEFYQGQLPAWLSPVQVAVLPVSEAQIPEARQISESLLAAGIRVFLDERAGNLSKRIRAVHRLRPFAKLILGEQEIKSGYLNLQLRKENHKVWRVNLLDELKSSLSA